MNQKYKIKKEIVQEIATRLDVPKHMVRPIVDYTFQIIWENLAKNYQVRIRNFGVFTTKEVLSKNQKVHKGNKRYRFAFTQRVSIKDSFTQELLPYLEANPEEKIINSRC